MTSRVIRVLIGQSSILFGEVSFQVFAHFYGIVYCIIELYAFFKYSDTNPMSNICIMNTFLWYVAWLFNSLIISFEEQKILFLVKSS